jgi:hypothetical protein
MPFEDWALFVDAFSGGIAAQPQIRGLDLELIDSALEFGRPLGRRLWFFLRACECGREQPHAERS